MSGPKSATFERAVAAHAWEIDDFHQKAVVCPGCVVLPSLLAGLEFRPETTWGQVLSAYLAGYTVSISLAQAAGAPDFLKAGWWPTSLFGPVGGAATLSLLVGHSPDQTASAMAIAAQQAGGSIAGSTAHSDARLLLAGFAAERALQSVVAADEGWLGPRDFFDNDRSPLRIAEATIPASGSEIMRTSVKLYPAANHVQAAIGLTLDLLTEARIGAEEIICLEAALPAQIASIVDRPAPFGSRLERLTSAQYILASAAVSMQLTVDEYDRSKHEEDAVLSLASRVRVVSDHELARDYPDHWGARITVTLADGRVLAGILHRPRGDTDGPPHEGLLHEKFVRMTRSAVGAEAAHAAFERMTRAQDTAMPSDVIGADILNALGFESETRNPL